MTPPGRKQFQKTVIISMILVFVLQIAGVMFLLTKSAFAYVMPTTDVGAGFQRFELDEKKSIETETARLEDKTEKKAEKVEAKVADRWYKGMVLTASVTLKNALVSLSKIAAEKAVGYLATGSWGEGPMFYEQAFDVFKQNLVDGMINNFITNINDYFGIDICHPEIPFELSIKLFLLKEGYADLKKPDCSLSELKHNWGAFLENIQNKYKAFKDDPAAFSVGVLQETFTVAFVKESTEIGGLVVLKEKMKQKVADDYNAKRDDRIESQGIKPVVSITGDFIETPAILTRSHTAAELEKATKTQESEMAVAGDVLAEIPGQVGVAFFNSFVSKFWSDFIIKKVFEKGIVVPKPTIGGVFDVKGQMKTEFANQKINYSFAQKQIDLLSEFATCSDPRQINNCVMDNDFADAVREATQNKPMTVAEAIDLGRLNDKKLLIGPNDERNSSDDCYEIGFCYSNLVKLRTARIIPIGWEIAAKLTNKGEEFSLQAAIDDFNDSTSKYFHLIDPNWVLRYPQTQCKAFVNGPLIVAPKAAERAEVCVDAQSCLKTDDKGKCQAWGYCAAEKNIFRFSGQECQGVYDSCQTYKGPKGKEVSFVSNTVDKKYCSADNAGCLWYSKDKVNKNGVLGPWSSGATHDKRIYLNGKITDQECAPNQEGCNRFISTEAGLGTNLLTNSGFEIFSESNKVVDEVKGWNWYDATDLNNLVKKIPALSVNSFSGAQAADIDNNYIIISDEIKVAPKPFIRYFAVSAQVKKDIEGFVSANIDLVNLTTGIYATLVYPGNGNKSIVIGNKGQWENIKAIFSVGPGASAATFKLDKFTVSIEAGGGKVFVDNVLLEELDGPLVASTHVYSDYATQNAVYVKKAPEYLGCYDTTAPASYGRPKVETDILKTNDVAGEAKQKGCKDFAQLCTAEDVGCAAYKPTDKGSIMNGVVSYSDYCPQECSGYASYAKSATNFENSAFPLYFIPSTAEQCTAIDAGCEEFTNLDVLPQGGEAKEYYKELRMCVELPEGKNKCSTYYTWEGSEVTGYQLQAHELEKSADGPALVDASYAGQCDASTFAKKNNPDCRQFFDAGGKAYYKLFSKTILCTADCHPYRRTDKYIDNAATANANEAKDLCENKKGKYDLTNNECVFMAVPTASKKCSAQNNGCREYRGNQAGVEFELENYTFSGAVATGSPVSKLKGSVFELKTSPEFGQYLTVKQPPATAYLETDPALLALSAGDYRASFWLKKTNASIPNNFSVILGNSSNSNLITENWTLYNYNFTVDAANASNYKLRIEYNGAFDIDNLKIVKTNDLKYLIRDSWTTPTSCDYKLNSNLSDATNYLPQAQLGCREFKTADNGTSYLKSLSGLCPAEKVGCQAIIDTQGNEYPFEKEFNRDEFKCDYTVLPDICDIGLNNFKTNCIAKGGTLDSLGTSCVHNSNITVPGDSLLYLVVNDKVKCPASEKGCTALGLPTLTVDDKGDKVVKTKVVKDKEGNDVTEWLWSNLFYKLDPENFEEDSKNNPLCKYFESDCEKYDSADSKSSYYFKNPGDKMCEYRQGLIGGTGVDQKVYAWFKKKIGVKDEKDVECTDVKEYYADASMNVFRNTDENYSGWTASCPKSQDKCTAFLDPTDKHKDAAGAIDYPKAYYYLNNENIDSGSCAGSVSRKEGCVLFNDTSSDVLKFTTTSTYQKSKKENGNLVSAEPSKEISDIIVDSSSPAVKCSSAELNLEYYNCLIANTIDSDVPGIKMSECKDKIFPAMSPSTEDCTNNYYLNHGDTNTIIKVTRDRECAAWYDCKSSHWVWNPNKSKYEEVCDQVGLCDQLDAESESAKCKNFVDSKNTTNLLSQNKILTTVGGVIADKSYYANRPTDWFALEYTGLAVPDLAPAQFYNAFDIAQGSGKKTCGGSDDGGDCKGDADCTDQSCETLVDYRLVNADDTECKKSTIAADCESFCGENNVSDNDKCRCLSNVCTKPFSSGKFADSKEPACRAYPEKDSPFPASAASNNNFEGVNFSYAPTKQDGDFACNYRKITYGNGAITKYVPRYPQYSPAPANGYCADEPTTPCECIDVDETIETAEGETFTLPSIKTKSMCMSTNCKGADTESGTCSRKDNKSKDYTGWEGYCLEEDVSLAKDGLPNEHPCLTWYPTQAMPGLQDFQNQYDNAGFNPASYGFDEGGPYYCVKSSRWEKRAPFIDRESGTVDCDGDEEQKGLSGYEGDYLNENSGDDWAVNSASPYTMVEGYGYCSKNDYGYDVKKIEECAIWGPCWTSDADCGHLNKVSCPKNYSIGDIVYFARKTGGECGWDYEDKVAFDYWCNPFNFLDNLKGSQTNTTPDSYGWFQDIGLLDKTSLKTKYGSGGKAYDNQDPPGYDNGTSSLLNEEERQACDAFYAISGTGENDLFENRAFTNRLYKYSKSDADICQNSTQAVGIDDYKIDKETQCSPLGALAINASAEGVKNNLENAFLYNTANSKEEDKIGWDCDMNSYYPSGGAHCFGDPKASMPNSAFIKDNIDTFFAKSYGYFEQIPVLNKTNGYCKSSFAIESATSCTKDKDCTDVTYTEDCHEFTLGICSDSSSQNVGNYCFTDMDCGAATTMAGKTVDDDSKKDIMIRKYCVGMFSPKKSACTKGSGIYYVLPKKADASTTEDKVICSVGRWSSDNGVCSLDVSGKPQTKDITDANAKCTFLSYPSNSQEVFYQLDENKTWDYSGGFDETFNKSIIPPTISAVVATTKFDSNGKTIYAAEPNKITVSTPDVEKTSGNIVYYGTQLQVSVKFYAWASDDQMPLRKITVDFNDGPIVPGEGKFQNHKPRCQREEHEKLGICNAPGKGLVYSGYACAEDGDCSHIKMSDVEKCKLSGNYAMNSKYTGYNLNEPYKDDRFGDTSQACLEGYFQYNHTYSCDSSNSAWDNYPINGKDVDACKFEIGVQAKDNWGWCNTNDLVGAYDVSCDPGFDKPYEKYDGVIYMIPL